MNESVKAAVEEIRAAYDDHDLDVQDDGEGGAWVIIEDVSVGVRYRPEATWVGFRITFQYPNADVYPHFVRGDLLRHDGGAMGDGISPGHNFRGRPAMQISRRSNRLNPATDTALLKLAKVLKWLETRP